MISLIIKIGIWQTDEEDIRKVAEPGNADIRANLEIARSKTIDKVIPVPEVFFVSWTKSLINCLSVDAWAKLGIVFFVLLLVSFYLFFFSKQIMGKKVGFIAGIVFLALVILSNVFAAQQKGELMECNEAIVLAPSVTVRSTPSESGTSLFILHEGRKVEIKDNSMREWKEIRLEDGKVGWVPASAIEGIVDIQSQHSCLFAGCSSRQCKVLVEKFKSVCKCQESTD